MTAGGPPRRRDPGAATIVRPATAVDAGRIAEIRIAAWAAAYRGTLPDSILARMSLERNTAWFARRIGAAGGVLVVVDPDAAIAGYAVTGSTTDPDAPGVGEVNAIYLDPARRGRGLGAALLAAAVAALAADGFREVLLWVLTTNAPARRFYERQGFRADGAARMLDFDGAAIEEVRYRRSIG